MTTDDGLPTPKPRVTPETERFWEATADEKLLLKRCADCGEHHHYPRPHCPFCFSDETEWVEASGEGTVYTYTVTHQNGAPYDEATPYVLAYVELEEGPRVMTNIVGVEPDEVSVGQDVSVVFDDTDEGEYALPRFEPE
ncbi:MAG: Zn-ribbon domain-containing OB-fold protein [Halobacteriales archaeon]|nr:Zn-ribbon domain-containing OB-fold protein [Halobacteriales archaeon]